MTTTAPAPPTPSYPDASARRLLGDHLGKGDNYRSERIRAGKALIAQLSSLLKHYGLVTDEHPKGTLVSVFLRPGAAPVVVLVREDTGLMLLNVDGKSHPLPLHFNPDTKLFEGKEVDKELTPQPGQLRERRSALTTIVAELFGESPQG